MKGLLLIFLLSVCSLFWGQRLSTGFQIGVPVYFETKLPDNWVYPSQSYYIYYTANEKKDDQPIYNQYINGIQLGLNLNLDYKRHMLSLEMGGGFTTIALPLRYPAYINTVFGSNYSNFRVTRGFLNSNLIYSYKLLVRANSPFIEVGMQAITNTYKEGDRQDLDRSIAGGISLFVSDYEMNGILYNDINNYFNYVAGVGFTKGNSQFKLRYSNRMFAKEGDLPLASFQQFDFVFNQLLTFQKLRKGHKLFLE
jgi:hypothetical protein